ncbi:MAG: response regulator [Acidobacteriia bacterium]|nr:response regulator [Terriglobia bacterium]
MLTNQLRVLVVDQAEDGRRIREMLATAEPPFTVHCAETLVSALDALARHNFDIAVVEISLPDSEGLPTFETIRRHARGLPVVVYTGVHNEALAPAAVQRGAQDYLIKGKVTAQALARVLHYAVMRQQGQDQPGAAEAAKAKVIGILAAKGGVGATTFASHFSLELKRQTGGKVLLLDPDPSSASASFLMKIESKYTVADAAGNLNRLDAAFWGGVVATGPGGLDVLQAPGTTAFGEPVASEPLRHVLRFARTMYDSIVVDLGRLSPVAMSLLEETSEIYVVTTNGLPEMYEATRVVRALLDRGFNSQRVHLVFNRVPKGSSLPGTDLARVFGVPVFWTIFDCAADLEEAYAVGRFLVEALPLRKQIAQLVARSLGVEPKAPARGLLRLFKLAPSQ